MLVQAASGLERLVVGNRDKAVFKDSTVAQISAYVYYEASVIAKLTKNKAFQQRFTKTIFYQIQKDFPAYIDAQARTKPKSLHHVYEWKKTGQATSRLFKFSKLGEKGVIETGFLLSIITSVISAFGYVKSARKTSVFPAKSKVLKSKKNVLVLFNPEKPVKEIIESARSRLLKLRKVWFVFAIKLLINCLVFPVVYKSTVIPENDSDLICPPSIISKDSGSFTDNSKFKVDWFIFPETNLDSTSKPKRLVSALKAKDEKAFKLLIDKFSIENLLKLVVVDPVVIGIYNITLQ